MAFQNDMHDQVEYVLIRPMNIPYLESELIMQCNPYLLWLSIEEIVKKIGFIEKILRYQRHSSCDFR